jgi:hypothetical protein
VEEGYRREYTILQEDDIQWTRNTVYVKGKFLETYSKKCTDRATTPLSVSAERITALAMVFYGFP